MVHEIILGICLAGVKTEPPLEFIYLDQEMLNLLPCGEDDLIITSTLKVLHER